MCGPRNVGVLAVVIAYHIERAGVSSIQFAPVDKCLLRAMGHPDLLGTRFQNGAAKVVPVGMVGQDQRQLCPSLTRPRPNTHPPRGHRRDRITEPAGPTVRKLAGRTHDDFTGKLLAALADRFDIAKFDPLASVIGRQLLQCAVKVDRLFVTGRPQFCENTLRLAERIGTDQMGLLRKQLQRRQQLGNLLSRRG